MHTRRLLPALIAAIVLPLAACSVTGDATAGPPPSPAPSPGEAAPPAPGPTTPRGEGSFVMDWEGPFGLTLPNGWTVRDCEGGRADACVYAGDDLLGDIELLTDYPLDDDQRDAEGAVVLAELADGFLAHFAEDRAAGCAGFTFVADEVRDVTVGGLPGKRASFSLLDADGVVVERVINHFVLPGDTYAIVNTDAYVVAGGCLGPSETDTSFVPDDLAALEPYLDRLVAETGVSPTAS